MTGFLKYAKVDFTVEVGVNTEGTEIEISTQRCSWS